MTLRPILIHPDPRLKKMCEPIARITPEIETLAADMLATMYDAPGIGLAAPQVAVTKRLFVADASRDPDTDPRALVMVNPELDWVSDEKRSYEEGCLSVPDQYADVTRPTQVRLRWTGLDGKAYSEEFDGLWATCVQHELDHLNGVMFMDHISAIKRQMITRRMVKLKREIARGDD